MGQGNPKRSGAKADSSVSVAVVTSGPQPAAGIRLGRDEVQQPFEQWFNLNNSHAASFQVSSARATRRANAASARLINYSEQPEVSGVV
jgi:hypothetical protein